MAKKGLGRGLDVLLGDEPVKAESPDNARPGLTKLPVEFIIPDPKQPRKSFADEAIAELAESIREKGLLQPILVRPVQGESDRFMIVAGERRWRAAQQAQLHEVPVIIREFTDVETSEIALIENLQRVDLNPVEEADAYQHLADSHGRTQAEIAEAVGKSRSHIANMMRLLSLPPAVKDQLRGGALSMGHARAILGAERPEKIAREVVEKDLSVRATEALVRKLRDASAGGAPGESAARAPKKSGGAKKDADTRALENDIAEALGLEVSLDHSGKKGGTLTIEYNTLDQLDDICRRLMNTTV